MEGVSCPDCKGSRLSRYGKTKIGLQKYRCLDCKRQFVAGSDHLIDAETKKTVLGLLAQGVHPKKIANAIEGVSLRWIYELRKRTR